MVVGERLQQGKGPSSNAFPTAWLGRRAQGEELPPSLREGKDGMLRERLIPRGSAQCGSCTFVRGSGSSDTAPNPSFPAGN